MKEIKKKFIKSIDAAVGFFYSRHKPEDYRWSNVKKIIVIRPDRIGDLVLLLPALRELKKKRPDINLTMLVSSYTKELLEGSKIVDSLVILDKINGFRKWLRFIKILRQVEYDAAIDMVFSRKLLSGMICFLTKSRIKLGFSGGLKGLLLNCKIEPEMGHKYEAERNFELLRYLIPGEADLSLTPCCIEEDESYINSLLARRIIGSKQAPWIGIHPGAYKNAANRSWPKEKYAILADRLIQKYNARVFFTGSQEQTDKELLDSIESMMDEKAVFIKGDATLRQIYSLCRRLDAFISTFTGPMHLAASAGIPVIVLGGPTPAQRWMPKGERHILLQAGLDCVPCNDNVVCARRDYACMKNIKVEDVLLACGELFAKKQEFASATDIRRCNCCDGIEFNVLYVYRDEKVKRCSKCGVIFTDSIRESGSAYYNQAYYERWKNEAVNRKTMWQKRLEQLNRIHEPGLLLDVGCGLGEFVSCAQKNGWKVKATEISGYAADYVSGKLDVEVFCGDITQARWPAKQFDAVTMWHVLEHTDNPSAALKATRAMLKDDGLLVVEVPNADYLVQLLKNYLKTRNFFSSFILKNSPEPHLMHFSLDSLKKLLTNTGFQIKNIYVGVYGEHQSGILRRFRSKIYNVFTVLVYLLTRKNIGVNTRIYARKKSTEGQSI